MLGWEEGSKTIGAIVLATLWRCIAAISLTLSLVPPALAQAIPSELHVVAGVLPPFVIKQGDELTGFSVDLWNEISARMKVRTSYQIATTSGSISDATLSKDTDVVVSGIYYTTERDREFDFSYPILDAGLQIMVRDDGRVGPETPVRDVVALLFSRSAAEWLGVALLIVVIPAHLVWVLDRGNEEGVSPSKNYFPGIIQALSWAATALVSQVQQLPGHWLARVLGFLWMFAGVIFISLYTAQLTATLTTRQIRGAIDGPEDLPGKQVGTIANSVAAKYLREIGANVQELQTTDEMFAALLAQRVDAVLSTSPIVRYYAAHDGIGRVKVVGPEFNRQDIGLLFPLGSLLRRPVNSTLLAIREDGTYARIYKKWFGSGSE